MGMGCSHVFIWGAFLSSLLLLKLIAIIVKDVEVEVKVGRMFVGLIPGSYLVELSDWEEVEVLDPK